MKNKLFGILLIALEVLGVASMLTPIGRALESSAPARVWSYSLYTRIFGGGFTSSSQIANCGPLTFAWCLSLFSLAIVTVLVILYFCKIDLSRVTKITVFGMTTLFTGISSVLYFCSTVLVGNTTDAVLGIGAILSASVMVLSFVIGIYLLFKSVLAKE